MPTEIRYRNMRRKRKQMIDFNRPAFTGREFDYIRDAVQRGMLCGDGEYTKRCSQWMMDKFLYLRHEQNAGNNAGARLNSFN